MKNDNVISKMTESDLPAPLEKCAKAIGLENVVALSETVGGERIHMPKPENLLKTVKKRLIIEEYIDTDHTIETLAAKYDLSPRTVWGYVKDFSKAIRRFP